MKKITFHRPNEYFNKNCPYEIYVGNKKLTELKNGEEKVVEIPNELEKKSLKAKIQWCGSEEIDMNKISENGKIIVSGNKLLNRKLPLIGALFPLTGIMIFITNNVIAKNIGIGLLILFLIGLVGTLTIGRNKWLNLKTK